MDKIAGLIEKYNTATHDYLAEHGNMSIDGVISSWLYFGCSLLGKAYEKECDITEMSNQICKYLNSFCETYKTQQKGGNQ